MIFSPSRPILKDELGSIKKYFKTFTIYVQHGQSFFCHTTTKNPLFLYGSNGNTASGYRAYECQCQGATMLGLIPASSDTVEYEG
jgi:hypothetical protein